MAPKIILQTILHLEEKQAYIYLSNLIIVYQINFCSTYRTTAYFLTNKIKSIGPLKMIFQYHENQENVFREIIKMGCKLWFTVS